MRNQGRKLKCCLWRIAWQMKYFVSLYCRQSLYMAIKITSRHLSLIFMHLAGLNVLWCIWVEFRITWPNLEIDSSVRAFLWKFSETTCYKEYSLRRLLCHWYSSPYDQASLFCCAVRKYSYVAQHRLKNSRVETLLSCLESQNSRGFFQF